MLAALSLGISNVGCSAQGGPAERPADAQTDALTSYKLKSIAVTPTPSVVYAGAQVALTATGSYTDGGSADLTGSATWSSSNPAVATVTSGGLVTAVNHGAAVIDAVIGTVTGKARVTVDVTLTSIAITGAATALPANVTATLKATGTYDNNRSSNVTNSVAWSSSNPAVASVSSTGELVTLAPGSTVITASTSARAAASTVIGVLNLTVDTATVSSVTVTPANPSVPQGVSQKLTATAQFTDGSSFVLLPPVVSWSSSNPSVAAVSAAGVVTGVGLGKSSITAQPTGSAVVGLATVAGTAAKLVSIALSPQTRQSRCRPPRASPPPGLTPMVRATTSPLPPHGRRPLRPWPPFPTPRGATGSPAGVAPGASTITATDPKTKKAASTALTVTPPLSAMTPVGWSSMVYDPVQGDTLLFGGGVICSTNNTIWSWDGTS